MSVLRGNKIILNLGYYSFGIIIPGVLSFLLIPVIIGMYSPAVYAEYSLVFNSLAIVSMFCYGWVGQSYIRFYSSSGEAVQGLTLQLLRFSLLAGFIVFTVLVFLISKLSLSKFLFFIPAFFLSGYYSFFLISCQAKQQALAVAKSELVRAIVNIALPLIFYLVFKRLHAIEVLSFTLCISYLLPLILFSGRLYVRPFRISNVLAGTDSQKMQTGILQYGLPIAVFLSVSLALSVNDRYFIARFMNYETAGKYAAVYDVCSKGVTAICSPVLMAFYPYIAQQYNDGHAGAAYKSLQKALLIEGLIFITGFVFLWFGLDTLLQFVLRESVPGNFRYIALLVYAGVFLWQIAMLLHKPLELQKKTIHLAIGVILAFVCNLAANYFLIQQYHNVAIAAWTTLGGSVIYVLYIAIFLLKRK